MKIKDMSPEVKKAYNRDAAKKKLMKEKEAHGGPLYQLKLTENELAIVINALRYYIIKEPLEIKDKVTMQQVREVFEKLENRL